MIRTESLGVMGPAGDRWETLLKVNLQCNSRQKWQLLGYSSNLLFVDNNKNNTHDAKQKQFPRVFNESFWLSGIVSLQLIASGVHKN